jgi:ribosomal protein L40E
MPPEATQCPKCNGEMEPGLLVARAQHDMARPTEWLEGEAEHSFWTGLKTKGRDRFPVRVDRCRECGFLESYAPKP